MDDDNPFGEDQSTRSPTPTKRGRSPEARSQSTDSPREDSTAVMHRPRRTTSPQIEDRMSRTTSRRRSDPRSQNEPDAGMNLEEHLCFRDYSASTERTLPTETHTGITIVVLNVGGAYHIMNSGGIPAEDFLCLLGCISGPAIVNLCDMRMQESDPQWGHFTRELAIRAPRYRVRALRGTRLATHPNDPMKVKGGCALIVTKEFNQSPIQPTPHGCDHIELHIKNWNIQNIDQRLVILNTYFPYNIQHASRINETCEKASNAVAAGNIVVLTGDLNQQQHRANKQTYGQKLINAGLQRVETPVTGIQGGKAEGIWTSQPEVVRAEDISVWKQFANLSDHHYPLVFKVPITIAMPQGTLINLKSEMRRVNDKAAYSVAVNSSKTEEELHKAMTDHTTLPPKYVPYRKYRTKKFDMHNPTKAQLKRRIEEQREFIARTETRNKRVFREAYYNGPMITNMIKRTKMEQKELDRNANVLMAKTLVELSWRVASNIKLGEYFDQHKHLYERATRRLRDTLLLEYNWREVHACITKLKHHTVYADFEARCVHLMGQPAMELIAAMFTRRAHAEVHETVRKILGIPTGKSHNEKEITRIFQKEFRPIGIAALLDALYFLCQNERVAPIVVEIAPECMHGFITGREGHDMIIEVQSLQDLAEVKKEPLFLFTADIEKHFDMLPHEAIAYIDTLMDLDLPFFQRVAAHIRSTVNHVRVRDGKPGIAVQNSGGSQGCHLTPSLSALILAPLAEALKKHAAASVADLAPEKRERAELFRKVINYADDWQLTSNDFGDGYKRFCVAEEMCDLLKMKIKLVSISRNDVAYFLKIPKLLHNGTEYSFLKAVRILGACVHMQKNSECAPTKCGGKCKNYTTTKLCDTCLETMIVNVGSLPLPILDKVEIARKRILSVMEWAVYTCVKQQEALLRAADKLRHQLCGHGYGGYIKAAVLPAKLGGYGIETSQRHIAILTAATIERCLERNGEAAQLLIKTRRLRASHMHKEKWAPALHNALKMEGRLQLDLHPSLIVLPEEQRSQNSPAQLHIIRQEWKEETSEKNGTKVTEDVAHLAVVARAQHGRATTYHLIEKRANHEKKWEAEKPPTHAYIRMLARVIERESEISRYVTLAEPLQQSLHNIVQSYVQAEKKWTVRGRAFLSVIARTQVKLLTNDDTTPDIPLPEEDKHIPKLFPISVTEDNVPFVKTSLRAEAILKLNMILWEEYADARQVKDLIGDAEIDHEASAVCAGTLRGVHYDGPLKTNEADKLLQIRTGSLFKTDKTKCGCGEYLSMAHIAQSHVSYDDLEGVLQQALKTTKFGPINVGLHTPKFLAFGFIPAGMFPAYVPPDKQKAFKKWKSSVAADFARVGLRAVGEKAPELPEFATPEFVVPTGKDDATKSDYLALADAALDTSQPGVVVYGLGGYVQDKEGRVIKQFMVRRTLPREDSCLGEHCASLVLAKMVQCLGLRNVCFGADNIAVPNQNDGNWATKSELSLKVRERTLAVRANIQGHVDAWFPREENQRADALSKQALRRSVCEPEWVKELDEVLHELFPSVSIE